MIMSPLTGEGKPLDVSARLTELTGLVEAAARDGLPAHELEHDLWSRLLQLGHDLQATYFALAGDGDRGERLTLTDGRVVKRLPARHHRPYRSIFGDFTLARVVYGTREGQRIEAVPLDARLGLPRDACSYLLQNWNQALVVENPYGQVNAVLGRILPGLEAVGGQPGGDDPDSGRGGNAVELSLRHSFGFIDLPFIDGLF